MTDFEAEVLAVANFHNFLLEVLLAENFSLDPAGKESLTRLGDAILSRIEQRTTVRPGDEPDDEEFVELKTRMFMTARRFFERTESRRAEIAAARKP